MAEVSPANDKLLNVLFPVSCIIDRLIIVKLTLLKVLPPPIKLGPPPDKTIEDVFALNVRFMEVEKFIADPVVLKVTVLLPKVMVRSFVLEENKATAVRLKLTVLNVPLVTVKLNEPIFKALPRVQPQPTPLITVDEPSVTPLVVNV